MGEPCTPLVTMRFSFQVRNLDSFLWGESLRAAARQFVTLRQR